MQPGNIGARRWHLKSPMKSCLSRSSAMVLESNRVPRSHCATRLPVSWNRSQCSFRIMFWKYKKLSAQDFQHLLEKSLQCSAKSWLQQLPPHNDKLVTENQCYLSQDRGFQSINQHPVITTGCWANILGEEWFHQITGWSQYVMWPEADQHSKYGLFAM